jgi:hypothetical protein
MSVFQGLVEISVSYQAQSRKDLLLEVISTFLVSLARLSKGIEKSHYGECMQRRGSPKCHHVYSQVPISPNCNPWSCKKIKEKLQSSFSAIVLTSIIGEAMAEKSQPTSNAGQGDGCPRTIRTICSALLDPQSDIFLSPLRVAKKLSRRKFDCLDNALVEACGSAKRSTLQM